MFVNSTLNATKIIGQRKAFYRLRIPEFSCAKKETVDIDILVTSTNGGRKIMQSIMRKWKVQMNTYQVNNYRKDLSYISTMSQGFKRGSK